MNHRQGRLFAAGFCLLVSLSGCGEDGGFIEEDILDQPATGRLDGAPWTAIEGGAITDPTSNRLNITLFAEDTEECSTFVPTELGIVLTSVPAEEGVYPLNLDSLDDGVVVNFVNPDNVNFITTDGLIVVEEITPETVTLRLVAVIGESDINGRIVVDRCD